MSDIDRGQVSKSAAEIYEEFFLPALFQEWAKPVITAAEIKSGESVLDIACGTGVLARTSLEYVGSTGSVIGLDINEGMLNVAQAKTPAIEWRKGQAEHLPFDDNSFDVVVSQFGLMFFEDKVAALKEMGRVLKSEGRLAVAVWDSLENTPGYAAMTELLRRLFGDETAKGLESPYSLGNKTELDALFSSANIHNIEIKTQMGTAQFASIEAWVHTDIKGWTLADMIDDKQYSFLLAEAKKELAPFITSTGEVKFDAPAHIVVWHKA